MSSNTNGKNVTYAWDADNRLAGATDHRTNGVTNYSYDATSQLSSMQYPNGVSHAFTYDNRDRTMNLSINSPSGALASYAQTFGFSGHKLSVSESTGRGENYSYDPIYRLLGETIAGDPTSANNGSLNYGLDEVGNRNSLTSTLAALQSQTATFDPNDRISGDTFDANGNTLTSNGVTYGYEFEDRLVNASSGVTIIYDGAGNRVSETAGGVTTKFLVDQHNPTGYVQVAEEIVSGAVTAQYTHGMMRISQNRGGAVSYYGYDGGGSVRQLLNSTGAVTDTYAYDALGNTVARTGSMVNPYQCRGEQFDASLGMYYLRARWYIPRTGRFLTADTWEGCPCDPASINRYVYVRADPSNLLDPTGHDSADEYGSLSSWSDRFAFKRFLKSIDTAAIERICITAALIQIRYENADPDAAWRTYVFCRAAAYAAFN